ncbi:MAG: bifunctional DNA-formamidopyrimidine glycosylase/DNA-(apurinic or apyrimidinic site) lyase [Gemmatimonadaceae bacterium]
MPELPEVETIARELDSRLAGRTISETHVLRPDVLRETTAGALVNACSGVSIRSVHRRAKSVVIELATDHFVLIQPRFTGAVIVDAPGLPAADSAYTVVHWQLSEGGAFRYRDVRRLGTVTLLDASGMARYHARIGDEPLDPAFTPDRLSVLLRGSRSAVKKVLMDQRVLAGVGNIYANEALFEAGIDPSREARGLMPEETSALHEALVSILHASIQARGTTFRDYRDPSNQAGGYAAQLRAYGRGGEPCVRCGTPLAETHAIDGRTTVFCFRCQH